MGDDARSSVVDRWNMSHDVPNLGVLDASVFVTAAAVNPTSTLCALSLRAAEHLLDRRSALPAPSHPTRVAAWRGGHVAANQSDTEPAVQFGVEDRARLRSLAGIIIPASDALPAGCDVALEERALDRIISSRPDLAPLLKGALAESFEDPTQRLNCLRLDAPAQYQALLTVVVSGYYLDRGVRAQIGYDGQVAKPVRPDNYPAYIAEGLLDHLFETI